MSPAVGPGPPGQPEPPQQGQPHISSLLILTVCLPTPRAHSVAFHKPLAQPQRAPGCSSSCGRPLPGRESGRERTRAAAPVPVHSQGAEGDGLGGSMPVCQHTPVHVVPQLCTGAGAVTPRRLLEWQMCSREPGSASTASRAPDFGTYSSSPHLSQPPPLPPAGANLSPFPPQQSSAHNAAWRRHLKPALQVLEQLLDPQNGVPDRELEGTGHSRAPSPACTAAPPHHQPPRL